MKNSRRDFLKKATISGAGLVGTTMAGQTGTGDSHPFPHTHSQSFNMSGYAAPKLKVVRVAVIGLGNRGTGTVRRLASIEDVEIKALSDLEPERVQRAADRISHLDHDPDFYSGHKDEWKKICERQDIDLVAIATPWSLHTKQCVYAMEHDKHTYTELPAATTMEECWQLVETSERTRKHCVQMSASCSGGTAAVVLNMARKGFFGDLIHAEGCYIHDLLEGYLFTKQMYHNIWRLKENIGRHGMVPIIQMLDLNCGDKLDYLVSLSSNDFMMNDTAERLAEEDDFWNEYVDRNYRGNMNVTLFRTVKGRSIVLNHDVTSPRPRGRRLLSGTRAIWQAHPNRVATSHDGWVSEEEFRTLVEECTPETNRRFAELTEQAEQIDRGGHSYYRTSPTDWRLIDCLRNGLPTDMNVYEAALSSSVTPLSVWSVANRSQTVSVPDFTSGAWESNQRGMDIELEKGGGSTRLV